MLQISPYWWPASALFYNGDAQYEHRRKSILLPIVSYWGFAS